MNKIIVGNLKMNLETLAQRDEYCLQAYEIFKSLSQESKNKIIFCPPVIHLDHFVNTVGKLPVGLGAQDCFWELHGSYTGSNSPKSISSLGARYVILGHSERREYNWETDEIIAQKTLMALRTKLTPIVCVGYVQDDENEMDNIKNQINFIAENIDAEIFSQIIFAYEPIWAVGQGNKTPTIEEIHTVGLFIRKVIANIYTEEVSSKIKILYGGSVDLDNVVDICNKAYIQGVLVGRGCLNPQNFARIVQMLN